MTWNLPRLEPTNIAVNPIVGSGDLLCLYSSNSTMMANAAVMTVVVSLALFFFIALFLSIFPWFSSPPVWCRYLPLLLAVSSVQQLVVSLHQHVGCFCCSRSDFLPSHYSEPLVFSVLFSLFFLCYGLACFVLLSCQVRRHSTCFVLLNHCDQLLFGSPCLTVCNPILCISLEWIISTDTGCTQHT